jgi:hypothetical protein
MNKRDNKAKPRTDKRIKDHTDELQESTFFFDNKATLCNQGKYCLSYN